MLAPVIVAFACVAVGLWLSGWTWGRWALWRRMRRLRRPRTIAVVHEDRTIAPTLERCAAEISGEYRTVPRGGRGVDVLN